MALCAGLQRVEPTARLRQNSPETASLYFTLAVSHGPWPNRLKPCCISVWIVNLSGKGFGIGTPGMANFLISHIHNAFHGRRAPEAFAGRRQQPRGRAWGIPSG